MLSAIADLAEAAGRAILEVYAADEQGVQVKADSSPVTEADLRAEAVILAGLAEIAPDIPVVAEESVAAGRIPRLAPGDAFFLVDPLDGTKEFLSRNGEFTVNIALVEAGEPVLGVVHTPVLGLTYVGGRGVAEVRRQTAQQAEPAQPAVHPLGVTEPGPAGNRVLVSRSHLDPATEQWLEGVRVAERVQAGSSLKFCRIAEGAADLYPRFGRTMEWDTAAGHAVLHAAGGIVLTPEGEPFRYGKPDFANTPFVAYGSSRP